MSLFRRELNARLAGHVVTLPGLADRRADLGWLIARRLAAHLGGRVAPAIERAAARALFRYAWPDNVRELDQVVIAALATASDQLRLVDLPPSVRAAPIAASPPPGAPAAATERGRLIDLLRRHDGNVSRVAEALATSRSQVRRLAARLAIDVDAYRR
jgi:transcriptional regulator of acetoin/glycerol metabolism